MMYLYVWEGVFCDYSCGMAFAIASSKREAIDVISGGKSRIFIEELESTKPKVYQLNRKSPIGFYTTGGS